MPVPTSEIVAELDRLLEPARFDDYAINGLQVPGEGVPAHELFERVRESTAREPLVFDAGPERVRTVAVLSGAGADYVGEAVAAGADAFITGEPAERVMADARERHVHFIAAGHY